MFFEVAKLTKFFGGLAAVYRLDLTIRKGEIHGLIGPNGSGKTTFFNLITGFLKPDSGSIYFKDKDITGLKPHKVCESGVVRTFQLVKPFGKITAVENVMVGRIYGRTPARSLSKAREESKAILDYVGLGVKGDIVAGTLTLPDRKRLELARALAATPHLLLLDEIMAGLNPKEVEQTIMLVQDISDSGVTIIMVEHNIRAVIEVSNRVTVISSGEKIFEGPPQEMIRDQRVIESYLGEA